MSWREEVRRFIRDFTHGLDVRVVERQLTDVLVEFRIEPGRPGAASIGLIASPFEVILSTGRHVRLEFDRLQESAEDVLAFVDAIVNGRFQERTSRSGKGQFVFEMKDGSRRTSRRPIADLCSKRQSAHHYAAYGHVVT